MPKLTKAYLGNTDINKAYLGNALVLDNTGVPIPLGNIISEYKFEDNVLDTVGSNNGVPTSITYTDGLVGRSGIFNGTTSKVTIPDSNDLTFASTPFSLSFLVNFDVAPTIKGLIIKDGGNPNREYLLDYITDGYRMILFNNDSSANIQFKAVTTPTISTWYSIIITFDGGVLASGGNIYIDGIAQALTLTENASFTGMTNTIGSIVLGNFELVGGRFLDGQMDSVRFWNKELNQIEITEIATQELAGTDINP